MCIFSSSIEINTKYKGINNLQIQDPLQKILLPIHSPSSGGSFQPRPRWRWKDQQGRVHESHVQVGHDDEDYNVRDGDDVQVDCHDGDDDENKGT